MLKKSDAEVLMQEEQPPASEVKESLRLILGSQPFRTSRQCQDLLRYVVHHSITGDGADLRERIIGAEVFRRDPAYDTNEDPVVRVRAADVRKRLAQYYQSLEPGTSALHIELSPGAYRARFSYHRPPQPEAVAPPPPSVEPRPDPEPPLGKLRWSGLRRIRTAGLALILLLATGAALWMGATWKSPQERFWSPLITQKQPVLIYLGANVGYVFSSSFLARYRAEHNIPDIGVEFFVDLPPGSSVHAEDIVPKKDTFVTTEDVAAVVQITTMLRDWKRPFVLRTGRDLSFGDLRNRPSVMIGAFNNAWTLELTNDLPFSFREGNEILNRDHPDRSWSTNPDAGPGTVDYALLTRLLSSKTGGPSITVSGIGEFGTLAAAEFLANPDKMRDLLKNAPRGWEGKNMQAVLSVKVVDFQPVSAEVVATSYW
jgi:hypothetical protein